MLRALQDLQRALRKSFEVERGVWLIEGQFRELVVVGVVDFLETVDVSGVGPELLLNELPSLVVPGWDESSLLEVFRMLKVTILKIIIKLQAEVALRSKRG